MIMAILLSSLLTEAKRLFGAGYSLVIEVVDYDMNFFSMHTHGALYRDLHGILKVR